MPLWKYAKKKNKVVSAIESKQFANDVDLKIFVRLNQQLLAKDNVENVLSNLESYAESMEDTEILKNVIHLSSRYFAEKKEISMGIERKK